MTQEEHAKIALVFSARMAQATALALRDLPLELLLAMRDEAHDRTEDAASDFESNAIGFAGALLTQAIAEKQMSLRIN
jgi:hypothetical protein